MKPLNRQETEDLIIDLYYNQKKTFREIQQIVRKSPRDIKVCFRLTEFVHIKLVQQLVNQEWTHRYAIILKPFLNLLTKKLMLAVKTKSEFSNSKITSETKLYKA